MTNSIPSGQVHTRIAVDNTWHLVDERSRAGLDAPHVWNRQWIRQAPNLTYPQGPKLELGPLSI